MSMAPSSDRGMESMSGVKSGKVSVTVFIPFLEPVVVVISDSRTKAVLSLNCARVPP